MVIKLKPRATNDDIADVMSRLEGKGLEGRLITGEVDRIVAVIGDETGKEEFLRSLGNVDYVSGVQLVSSPFKVIARETHPDYNGETVNRSWLSREVVAGSLIIGGDNPLGIVLGPCSVDINEPGIMDEIGAFAKDIGAWGLRVGAYKPRTRPYDFRGSGISALELGRKVADEYGLAVVSEPVIPDQIDSVIEYADVLQIGTRNATQGFYLDVARRTAESQMPILAKRGMAQLLLEEYVPLILNIYDNEEGPNPNVMLCVRGIRTFDTSTRFTLDSGSVPVLKSETILPVVGDPSHTAGLERYVVPHTKSLIASGVDGLIVEIYPPGEKRPLSDAAQHTDYNGMLEIVRFAKQIGRM